MEVDNAIDSVISVRWALADGMESLLHYTLASYSLAHRLVGAGKAPMATLTSSPK
jgi:hypothetical protein